jgi:hypothetical protein
VSNYLPAHQHTAACGHTPPPAPVPTCTHSHQPPAVKSDAGKWLAIGIGGSFLAIALAVSMVAFAIGATALTVCVLVLYGIWKDVRKGS